MILPRTRRRVAPPESPRPSRVSWCSGSTQYVDLSSQSFAAARCRCGARWFPTTASAASDGSPRQPCEPAPTTVFHRWLLAAGGWLCRASPQIDCAFRRIALRIWHIPRAPPAGSAPGARVAELLRQQCGESLLQCPPIRFEHSSEWAPCRSMARLAPHGELQRAPDETSNATPETCALQRLTPQAQFYEPSPFFLHTTLRGASNNNRKIGTTQLF